MAEDKTNPGKSTFIQIAEFNGQKYESICRIAARKILRDLEVRKKSNKALGLNDNENTKNIGNNQPG